MAIENTFRVLNDNASKPSISTRGVDDSICCIFIERSENRAAIKLQFLALFAAFRNLINFVLFINKSILYTI